jgi:hypothetical protein
MTDTTPTLAQADEKARDTPDDVSAEINRIRRAIAPGNGGDKEDLMSYAKEIVRLRAALRPEGEAVACCPRCDGTGFAWSDLDEQMEECPACEARSTPTAPAQVEAASLPAPGGAVEARRAADAAGYYGSIAACIEDLSRRVRAAEALAADASPSGWQDISTAPKDGTRFKVRYEDGTTEEGVYWADERYCILGAPQGSKGPGCMSSDIGLPVEPTHWRPQVTPPAKEHRHDD